MDEKLKTALVSQIREAPVTAAPEKADPELDVLASLAMASRGLDRGDEGVVVHAPPTR